MRDYETRDHYETFPTRRSAAEYAANTAIPDWLRNAWAAVARGEYRNVEEALKGLETRKQVRKSVRSQKRPARGTNYSYQPREFAAERVAAQEARERQRTLTNKMLDPFDVYQQMKMRELMKREHDPFWWD